MVLGHGQLGADPPRLADVGRLGQAVGGSHQVGAQEEAGVAGPAVVAGGLGLHPVEQAERELARLLEVARRLGLVAADQVVLPVVVLRPVHQRRVERDAPRDVVRRAHDLPVEPQREAAVGADELVHLGLQEGVGALPAHERPAPAGGQVGHIVAPVVVLVGLVDDVVGALLVGHGEAPGEPLHVVGLRGAVHGVRLARFVAALRAGHVLHAGHGKQVAEFRRVDDHGRGQLVARARCEVEERHGGHAVAVGRGGHGLPAQADVHAAGGHVGRQHRVQHGEGHPGLVADGRHGPAAGVQVSLRACLGGQRVVVAVVPAHEVAEAAVAAGASVLLDPRVLVGRHGLAGELAADPVGLLGHHHAAAHGCGRHGRGAAARSPAHHQDIRVAFANHVPNLRNV